MAPRRNGAVLGVVFAHALPPIGRIGRPTPSSSGTSSPPRTASAASTSVPPPNPAWADPLRPDLSPMPPDDAAAASLMQPPLSLPRVAPVGEATACSAASNRPAVGAEPRCGTGRHAEADAGQGRLHRAFEQPGLPDQSGERLPHGPSVAHAQPLRVRRPLVRPHPAPTPSRERASGGRRPSRIPRHSDERSFGFTRNLAAGGQLLVDFANSFVWEFSGSTLERVRNFAAPLIQPLLWNFGRQVRLESLTQAERDTLYAARSFRPLPQAILGRHGRRFGRLPQPPWLLQQHPQCPGELEEPRGELSIWA